MKMQLFFFYLTIAITTISFQSCDDGLFSDCRKSNGADASLELDLAGVSSFDFALSGNVIVTRGTSQQIIVSGPEDVIRNINTNVSNGEWDITTRECFRKYDPVTVTMQITDLSNVSLSGAGNITIMDTFATGSSRVAIAGSGNVIWKSISEQIEAIIGGSGNITMIGSADQLFGTVAGSGNILGRDLPVKDVDITIAGSGDAEVMVSESLKVRIAGSGSVYYYGDPDSINQNISGSGSVIKRD
ncbi:MAG: head GIN domain-containing protein [Cyclobacteriaceae bacterium]